MVGVPEVLIVRNDKESSLCFTFYVRSTHNKLLFTWTYIVNEPRLLTVLIVYRWGTPSGGSYLRQVPVVPHT